MYGTLNSVPVSLNPLSLSLCTRPAWAFEKHEEIPEGKKEKSKKKKRSSCWLTFAAASELHYESQLDSMCPSCPGTGMDSSSPSRAHVLHVVVMTGSALSAQLRRAEDSPGRDHNISLIIVSQNTHLDHIFCTFCS